ncbi:MaoC family dehydratase [Methylopila henanensis]|uniref:MaoC family dehydratase n=1 Tax=Methylopila henanensis TaxID=873516 RepID=A0ABW4KCM9_9HYPH
MGRESKDAWSATIKGKPTVGATARRTRVTSSQDIERFSDITGDCNPLHYDEAAAKASVFGRIIVQGGVTSGILNAVVAEDLPGPGTVFLQVSWRFVKAVGVGDQITGEIEVVSVRDDKPICQLKTRVTNEAGEECLVGEATVYVAALKATNDAVRSAVA